MAQERPILDTEAAERLPFCIPVTKPMPIPEVAWNELPTRCITVNAEWCSHILGALECLDQSDAWKGTPEEIFDARQQVREIMLAVQGAYECEVMPSEYLKTVVGCDSRTIEFTRVIDGVESALFVPLCDVIPEQYVRDIACTGGNLTFERVIEQVPASVEIDLVACGIVPANYVISFTDCTSGQLEINHMVAGEPEVSYLNLSSCLAGQFLTSADLPEVYTPIPSLIGDNLWFDTNGDSTADLDLGQVVYHGSDGSDGSDAPNVQLNIVGTDLYADTNGDDIFENLGRVVGLDGIDGACAECEPAPPEPIHVDDDDLCGSAEYLVQWIDERFDDFLGSVTGASGVVSNGVSLFLAATGVGAVLVPIVGAITALISADVSAFRAAVNNTVLDDVKCKLFCLLSANGGYDYATLFAWAEQVTAESGTNVALQYWASIVGWFPEQEWQKRAYIGSVSPSAACAAECDCEEDPPPAECPDPCGAVEEIILLPGDSRLVGTVAGDASFADANFNAQSDGFTIDLGEMRCVTRIRIERYRYITADTALKRTWQGATVAGGTQSISIANTNTGWRTLDYNLTDEMMDTLTVNSFGVTTSPHGTNFYVRKVIVTVCVG